MYSKYSIANGYSHSTPLNYVKGKKEREEEQGKEMQKQSVIDSYVH